MARDGVVTIIIGQAIRVGHEDEYVEWQKRLSAAASRYPGYLNSELTPPCGSQSDWTAIYRFNSVANAQNWLDSSTRQTFLDKGAEMFSGPGTRQVLAEGNEIENSLVTVLVTHRIDDHRVDEFLRWHASMTEAESRFPGFRGVEVFRPIEGVQNEWTICYKFDNAENLDRWLTSDQRRRLLQNSPFKDFKVRRIDHSFGNWFALGDQSLPPPSDFRSSIAVWMGLNPTIFFLVSVVSPLHLPVWAVILFQNLLSAFIMTYLTMPYYSNLLLGWWLRPKPAAPQPSTNILGIGLVLLMNALAAAVFYLLTTRLGYQVG